MQRSRAGNGTTLTTTTTATTSNNNATKEGDEEEIPLGVTIHVMEEDALGAKNGGGILKLRTPSQIREEIEQKIPFLAGKNDGARGLRINFKFDGIDGSNDSDSGAIQTLYRNVDVLPILRMIYDSIANDENLCARNVIPVLRDSPYWDGERREERGDANTITEERSRTKRFNNVCVGGTFDHAHAGHRLLLACAVAVTERRLDVGITSEALLANKKYKDYLQTYSKREQFCKDFIKASAPVGLSVNFGPLDENWPIAATREDVDALIVSEETVEGGLKINEERVKRGFGELELVVVDVLGKKENSSSSKLSSTRLRELEAERQT